MNRRDLMGNGLGIVAATTVAGMLGSATGIAGTAMQAGTRDNDLASKALECIRAGEYCITACLARGSSEAVSSVKACRECIAVCSALVTLAASESAYLKEYAALCAKVCRVCEAACRSDGGEDEACRACAEACRACATACEAAAAR